MKRTVIAICLLLLLALTLTACTGIGIGGDTTVAGTESGTPATGEVTSAPGEEQTTAPTEQGSYNYDELDTDDNWTEKYY